MKKLIKILLLTFCLTSFSQDTTYTIKTINKDRKITVYLIVSVLKNKIVKTERIDSYKQIEALNLRKKAKAKVYLHEIPNDKLKEDEYLKNGVVDNLI
jgi:hypothetical protein